MITLGIETSCDETSVAVLHDDHILANRIHTQEIHARYGGVVPEIASRAHLQKIEPLCMAVLDEAGVGVERIGLIAVTDRPGLAGALLVGIGFALGIHAVYGTPITGVNHLEGHISSVFLEHPSLSFPFLALVVSGGHTAIYLVDDFGQYRRLGQTVDDAAGEAFDKVGKMLGFGYPAGRAIEAEAGKAAGGGEIRFPVARLSSGAFDFSFSGLKTAVRTFLAQKQSSFIAEHRPSICRAFQEAVVGSLVSTVRRASESTGVGKVALVGGVACNGRLREALAEQFADVAFPSPRLCTDNAAMIALAGLRRYERGHARVPRMEPGGGL